MNILWFGKAGLYNIKGRLPALTLHSIKNEHKVRNVSMIYYTERL